MSRNAVENYMLQKNVLKNVDQITAAAERLESNAQICLLVVTVVRVRKLMAMNY